MLNSVTLLTYLKNKFTNSSIILPSNLIKSGNLIELTYTSIENTKKKIQTITGLIIKTQNRDLGKSFTLRYTIQNINIEQNFCIYSPNIIKIIKKQTYKTRRAKLYYLRNLSKNKLHIKLD